MPLPKIAEAFARAATTYDAHAEVQILAADRLAAYMEANTRDLVDGTMLEVGCGTGLFTRRLVEIFSNRHIFVTDISDEMLEKCRSRISSSNNNNHLIFQTHDANQSFADGSELSLVVAAFALQWLTDLTKSLSALTTGLAKNGTLFFSVPSDASFPEWKALCKRAGVTCTVNPLPTADQFRRFASCDGFRLSLYEESIKIQYRSLQDFLQSLKYLGAHTPNSSSAPSLTVAQLRRLLSESNLANPNHFAVTYNVLFGHLTRI